MGFGGGFWGEGWDGLLEDRVVFGAEDGGFGRGFVGEGGDCRGGLQVGGQGGGGRVDGREEAEGGEFHLGLDATRWWDGTRMGGVKVYGARWQRLCVQMC